MITNDDMNEIMNIIDKEEEHQVQEKSKETNAKDKKPRGRKPVQNQQVVVESTESKVKAPLIQIDEQCKDDGYLILNSDVLLIIIEVATNSALYGLTLSNKSRQFWNLLNENKTFDKVLTIFKTETLRKYWRIISEVSNLDKFISTVNKYKDNINNTSLKVLTIIVAIKDYLSGKIKDFATYLETPDKPSNINNPRPQRTKAPRLDDDDESFEDPQLLNTKRAKPDSFDNINKVIHENKGEEGNLKRSTRAKNTNAEVFTSVDKHLFGQIETIVNSIKNQLPELEDDEILEALKKNSFNIINTYYYLLEPETYEGKKLYINLINRTLLS